MRGIEMLRDRDERHVVPLEDFHQPGEVHQRSAEAVYLVYNDRIDPTGLDVRYQLLQRRSLDVAARVSAVVVTIGDRDPALGLLAGDVRLGRLALSIQRVEVLL